MDLPRVILNPIFPFTFTGHDEQILPRVALKLIGRVKDATGTAYEVSHPTFYAIDSPRSAARIDLDYPGLAAPPPDEVALIDRLVQAAARIAHYNPDLSSTDVVDLAIVQEGSLTSGDRKLKALAEKAVDERKERPSVLMAMYQHVSATAGRERPSETLPALLFDVLDRYSNG